MNFRYVLKVTPSLKTSISVSFLSIAQVHNLKQTLKASGAQSEPANIIMGSGHANIRGGR